MSEQFEKTEHSSSESGEQDLTALVKKMQQQLVFLEKKIDILISQSQAKPFGDKHFPRPHRSFDRPQRSFERGSHFEKRHHEEGEGSGYKHKSYGFSREGGFDQDKSFKKPFGGKKRGFDQKSKPFYAKYKQRDRA